MWPFNWRNGRKDAAPEAARSAPRVAAPAAAPTKRPMRVTPANLAVSNTVGSLPASPFVAYKPPPGVLPKGDGALAMDDAGDLYAYANNSSYGTNLNSNRAEGLAFLGYVYLAELAQRSEYRLPVEIIAEEMTRKWIRLHANGGEDKTDKLAQLNKAFERFDVQGVFRKAAETDGMFGKAHIFIDTGIADKPDELAIPLIISPNKIKKGGLKGFRVIDPIWTYAASYDSYNPLSANFYNPDYYYVQGVRVHISHMPLIIGRELPNIMKPAYNMGGMSLMQLMKPYVDNWLRTRQSVSDLIETYSIVVLATDMAGVLSDNDDGTSLLTRIQMFNQYRNNRGTMLINKESELLTNLVVQLGGLDHLQAQAQEHMATVGRIPNIKLFGESPSGLNATGDGEIRTFYDSVEAQRTRMFSQHIQTCLEVIQLNEFGEIDPDINWSFELLWQMSATERATIRKTEADTGQVLISEGVISPEEERVRISSEDGSSYNSLDPDTMPEKAEENDEDENEDDDDVDEEKFAAGKDEKLFLASDVFTEEDHKRDKGGKFSKSASMKDDLHPSNFEHPTAKKLVDILHAKVMTAHQQKNHVLALKKVKKDFSGFTQGEQYLDQLISEHEGVKNNKQQEKKGPSPKEEIEPSAETKNLHSGIVNNLDYVLGHNKPAVTKMLNDVQIALQAKNKKLALSKIPEIKNPSGMAQVKSNEYLNSLKKDYKITDEYVTEKAKEMQTKIAEAVKAAPPKSVSSTTTAKTKDGVKVEAKLEASTKNVSGKWSEIIASVANNKQELNDSMNLYHAETTANISDIEKAAIKTYQGSGYTDINDGIKHPPPSEQAEKAIKNLKTTLKNSVTPADFTVYRGISTKLANVINSDEAAIGKTFVHKSFASVSRNSATAQFFARQGKDSTLLKFNLPAGSKGLVMAKQELEAEILMDTHSIFRIDKIEKNAYGVDTVVHVTYLGHQKGT